MTDKLDIDHLRQWIGRTEEASDSVTAQLVKGLRATLFLDIGEPKPGDAAPFTTHWSRPIPWPSRTFAGMPESKPKGRILALDLGRRRVGSAVSDELGITAQGLDCFEIRGRQDLLAKIKEYQGRFEIDAIVLGKPSHLDGSPTDLSRMVDETKLFLERSLGLPVHLYDERFTSKISQQSLHQSGMKLKGNKKLLDVASATIILTDYLRSHDRS